MRFDFVVLVVLLNGCVCLNVVDEQPDSGNLVVDGGRDASVELPPVTSFIAPVPIEDLAESDWLYWRSEEGQWPPGVAQLPWRRIYWTTTGELLLDAVGGVILADGGYLSAANDPWRTDSHFSANSFHTWAELDGAWYRFTYPHAVNIPNAGPLRVWQLKHEPARLEQIDTLASAYDGGFWSPPLITANAVWGGSQLWIFDRVWSSQISGYTDARVLLPSSASTLSSAREIAVQLPLLADGIDGDTKLVWAGGYGTNQKLLRFNGPDFIETSIDAGYCASPYFKTSAPITVGCMADGDVDVWVADRDGARLIGRNEIPAERNGSSVGPFLVQLNPYRVFDVKPHDGGATLISCTSDACTDFFEVRTAPPNVGIDDAGALYIADYIFDAGVRVTRFAPGAW